MSSATPPPVLASLGSAYYHWDFLPSQKTPTGRFRAVYDGPARTMERMEVHVTELEPGLECHPPHQHAHEEMMILKEGELEVSLGGRKQRIAPGALVFVAALDSHNWKNVGSGPAIYYVINFFTEASLPSGAGAGGLTAAPGALDSTVVAWDAIVPIPNGVGGTRRGLLDAMTRTFSLLKVHATTTPPGLPGARHAGHRCLELIIIKEGILEYCIDGVTSRVGPGSLVYLAPEAVHTVRNVGADPATYYVFAVSSAKTPAA